MDLFLHMSRPYIISYDFEYFLHVLFRDLGHNGFAFQFFFVFVTIARLGKMQKALAAWEWFLFSMCSYMVLYVAYFARFEPAKFAG